MSDVIAGKADGAAVGNVPGPTAAPWAFLLVSTLLAIVLGAICYGVTGASLDLFIAGVFLAVFLVSPSAALCVRAVSGICIGISVVWYMAVFRDAISFGQWCMCGLVLASFALLLMATVRLLIRLQINVAIASAIVTLLSLAWLTWPIWLSSIIAGSRLHWSIVFQPILVINHIVSNLGIWTEQPVAYGLTNLGQDAQYQLPASAWPLIGVQCALALAAEAASPVLTKITSAARSSSYA